MSQPFFLCVCILCARCSYLNTYSPYGKSYTLSLTLSMVTSTTPDTNHLQPTFNINHHTIVPIRIKSNWIEICAVRYRSIPPGEIEALQADPGEEITAALKTRINAARQGLGQLQFILILLFILKLNIHFSLAMES